MSEIRTFMRSCPACGHRFHITLVNKKKVQDQRLRDDETNETGVSMTEGATAAPGGLWMPVVVEEGRPIEVEVEDFNYTYRCKHCGHEWKERHSEEHIS